MCFFLDIYQLYPPKKVKEVPHQVLDLTPSSRVPEPALPLGRATEVHGGLPVPIRLITDLCGVGGRWGGGLEAAKR